MQMRPNKTVIEGQATSVAPAPDGWGANVEFAVARSAPAEGFSDFLGATLGTTVRLFTAEPSAVQPGLSYTVTASVLGGPRGERAVIQDAKVQDP